MSACPSTRKSWGGSCDGTLAGRPLAHRLGAGAGEFRPRRRGHAKPGEAELPLKEDRRPVGRVIPGDDAGIVARRGLEGLIGLPQRDVDLAAIGAPPRPTLILEALVRDRDAGEVLVERFVLRRG